ncbi:MAG: sigma-70 family RNA polymerase sigma factor [Gemmatimonadales bacterium]|nr:sigma-70 family RNA polymerase sigma factor [Gemmatimonadales bacterium]
MDILFTRVRPILHGVVAKRIPERDDVEDVLQDICWSIARASHHIPREPAHLVHWILRISRQRALDHLRRRRTLAERERRYSAISERHTDPVDWQRQDAPDIGAAARGRLRSAMASLRAEERVVVQLTILADHTQRETAETLQIPLGTVKRRHRLALGRLRQAIA